MLFTSILESHPCTSVLKYIVSWQILRSVNPTISLGLHKKQCERHSDGLYTCT